MRRHWIKHTCTATISLALLASSAPPAAAADNSFIQQEWASYQSYLEQQRNLYNQYLADERKQYTLYHGQMDALFQDFVETARKDLNDIDSRLQSDAAQLQATYGSTNDDLKYYIREINKDRPSSALDMYKDAINPDHPGSEMDLYEDEIDQDDPNSSMDLFEDEINPDEPNSAMDLYEDDVNPDEPNGIMDLYEDEASIDSPNGIMDLYEDGKLSREAAAAKIKAFRELTEQRMNKRIEDTRYNITQRKNKTLQTIRDRRVKSMEQILDQRKKSLEIISKARAQLTGTGIEFGPLTVKPWVTVVIDGNYQIFEQPPVIQNGSTLVPLRAIFEKLGAEVKWNEQDHSVTATKGSTTVWLQIDSQTAKVNGTATSLETAPQMINGFTMVPLRFVSESLGADVQWNEMNTTVTITSK